LPLRIFSSEDYLPRRGTVQHPETLRDTGLELQVVFTDPRASKAALNAACRYARDLGARFNIIATHVIPYPLPLDRAPDQSRLLEQSLIDLTAEQELQASVQIYLCRDPWQTIRHVLQQESTIIIGGSKRWWWPTREQRLASKLRRDGHRVIFLDATAA
jgi:hypothetical protein